VSFRSAQPSVRAGGSPAPAGLPAHISSGSEPSRRIFIAISAAGVFRSERRRPRAGGRSTAASAPSRFPTRPPRSATAFTASRCTRRDPTCCSCRSTGTSCAATTPAESWKDVGGNLPTDFGFPIDVHSPRAEYDLRRPDQERLGALCARRQAARVPEPYGRPGVGGADEGSAADHCYVNVLRDAMPSTRSIRARVFGPAAARSTARPTRETAGRHRRDLPPVVSVGSDSAHDPGGLAGSSTTLARVDGEVRSRSRQGHTARGPRRARGVLPRCCAGPIRDQSRTSGARS